jgi:hypothetical protein
MEAHKPVAAEACTATEALERKLAEARAAANALEREVTEAREVWASGAGEALHRLRKKGPRFAAELRVKGDERCRKGDMSHQRHIR